MNTYHSTPDSDAHIAQPVSDVRGSNFVLAVKWAGLVMAIASVFTADILAETPPAEANQYLHLKDAFKNAPEEADKPRVLLIGDSISIGYTAAVRKNLEDRALVIRPPDNCQHTGYGLTHLKTWLGKGKWDVIHFNWGIWDTHLLNEKGALVHTADETKSTVPLHIRYTPEQYRQNLEKLVQILEGTGAKLIWASTTPIMSRKGARFDDIKILNEVAAEIMRAHKIETDDLYDFVLPHTKEWQLADQVHYNTTGNRKLSERVSESILKALPGKAP